MALRSILVAPASLFDWAEILLRHPFHLQLPRILNPGANEHHSLNRYPLPVYKTAEVETVAEESDLSAISTEERTFFDLSKCAVVPHRLAAELYSNPGFTPRPFSPRLLEM